MKEMRTASQLVELARNQLGDRSAPIFVKKGASLGEWSMEILLKPNAAPREVQRVGEIAQQLSSTYDLQS